MSAKAFTLRDKNGTFYIQPVDQFYDDKTVTSFISDRDSAEFDTSMNSNLEDEETNCKISEYVHMSNINRKVEIIKLRSILTFQILSVKFGNCVKFGNKNISEDKSF
jgi:hypothetical protein